MKPFLRLNKLCGNSLHGFRSRNSNRIPLKKHKKFIKSKKFFCPIYCACVDLAAYLFNKKKCM